MLRGIRHNHIRARPLECFSLSWYAEGRSSFYFNIKARRHSHPMKSKPALLAAILMLLLPGFAAGSAISKRHYRAIRFDGYYCAHDVAVAALPKPVAVGGTDYLRFYPDGAVILTSSIGTPEEITGWFVRTREDIAKGHYVINGRSVRFSTVDSQGRISFRGASGRRANYLTLRSHSYINGFRETKRYRFVEMSFPESNLR